MIHPKTELKHINDVVGYGVFATQFIPEGTIVYVKDNLELEITPMDYLTHTPEMKTVIDKYSYIDESGNRIVSWDFAKYVNHCCNCNTMSTGYGFEIAIRDIKKGEQITDEYGIFNIDEEMDLVCHEHSCRRKIALDDFDNYYQQWDIKIQKSLTQLLEVYQPLMGFVTPQTRTQLDAYFADPQQYKSVYSLKYHGTNGAKQKTKKLPRKKKATLPLDLIAHAPLANTK